MTEPLSIADISAQYRSGGLSPVDTVTACLARISATDPDLHAWVEVDRDHALAAARQAEQALRAGSDCGPLLGIPIAIKDIYDVSGMPTRCGSAALADAAPASHDAATVATLRAAGAIILGKTVTQEFAAGVISAPARNPWDFSRVPGGSSGGSAAAVALGHALGAMGSDTGGSIRIPAAACGVVGFKPTYGALSLAGVYPLSWSLDTAGPLARTVSDAHVLWQALSGGDASSSVAPTSASLAGIRIGVERGFFWAALQDDVASSVEAAIETLRTLGAEIIDVEWADAAVARAASFVINRVETAAVHERMARDEPDRFALLGPDLRLRVAAGSAVPATLYLRSMRVREMVRESMAKLFASHNLTALVAPSLPTTAVPADDLRIVGTGLDETIGAGWTRLTMPFNATGQPVLAMPCGFDRGNLPVGLQLAGQPGREDALFQIGKALESALALPVHPALTAKEFSPQ
jgi:aspartyl-tRNA(Asn)/glutamyl-tRNA(Gln) amidotransferase subunit A